MIVKSIKHYGVNYDILVDDDFTFSGGYFEVCGRKNYVRYWNPRTNKRIQLHRMVMNAPKGTYVDHINGNPLDNRRCNLRLVTPQQSVFNRGKNKNGNAPFKGITKRSKTKWEASIKRNGKSYYLGVFNCPGCAHHAYVIKAIDLFGEYANPGWEYKNLYKTLGGM